MKATGKSLLLPLYHAVSDEAGPHLRHLFPVRSAAVFERDLDFFLKNYQPVSLEEVVQHVARQKILTRASVLVTFDDGLREFYEVAAPILQRKGVPATCFLNPDFVGNHQLFFRFKISLLLEHLATHKKDVAALQSLGINDPKQLLQVTYRQQQVLDALANLVGLDFDDYLRKEQPYLSLEQVKALQQQGFTFGAHSMDHPLYSQLPLPQQLEQTLQSLLWVKEHLAPERLAFAFPFTDHGVKPEFFEAMFRDPATVDILFACAGIKDDPYPRNMQRLPMETGRQSAEKIVNTALMAYLLKKGIGRHKMERH